MAPLKVNSTVLAIKSATIGAGIIKEVDKHSGNLYGTLVRISGAEPVMTAQVPFAAAYSLIGFGSLAVTTLEFWLATFSSYERLTTGNKYDLNTSCTAMATITGWSVDQDGLLLADVSFTLISNDEGAHPLKAGSGTLPTLASQPALHTLGPLVTNGTQLDGQASAGASLNHEIRAYRGDGAKYPTAAARLGGMPQLTAVLNAPVATLTEIGLLGADISANVVQYFRAYDATTGEVEDSAGSGVSITVASGHIAWEDLSSQMQDVPTIGLTVEGLSTSSTHPFAVSLSATLP